MLFCATHQVLVESPLGLVSASGCTDQNAETLCD